LTGLEVRSRFPKRFVRTCRTIRDLFSTTDAYSLKRFERIELLKK
jgi:hypothetical protein